MHKDESITCKAKAKTHRALPVSLCGLERHFKHQTDMSQSHVEYISTTSLLYFESHASIKLESTLIFHD